MRLNHYTSVTQFQMISRMGLRNGKYFSEHHGVIPAVWFTTSNDALGHGLPDGSELSAVELEILRKRGEVPKNNFSVNKRGIKIIVNHEELIPFDWQTPQQGGVISFQEFSKALGESDEYRRKLAVRGYHPELPDISDSEILELIKTLDVKDKTWYVHFGNIPLGKIYSVEGYSEGVYSPLDFDLHVRPQMMAQGFFILPENIYSELEELWGVQPRYQFPVASCICRDPESIPCVQFMYQRFAWRMSIENPQLINDPGNSPPENYTKYVELIKNHKDVLNDLWQKSVDSYHTFYPARS